MKNHFLSILRKSTLVLLTSSSLYAAEDRSDSENSKLLTNSISLDALFTSVNQIPDGYLILDLYHLPHESTFDLTALTVFSENEALRGPLFHDLMAAIDVNNVGLVSGLLEQSQVDSEDNTPQLILHDIYHGFIQAIQAENINMVQTFLQHCTGNIELEPSCINHFFQMSIQKRNNDIISLFLENPKINSNLTQNSLDICFKHAVHTSNQEMIQFFLQSSPRLHPSNDCMENRFDEVVKGANADIASLLLSFPESCRPRDEQILHIFRQAIGCDHPRIPIFLMSLPNLPLSEDSMVSIWHKAVQFNKPEILRYLLNRPDSVLTRAHVDRAFVSATTYFHETDVFNFLLNLPEEHLCPSQEAIDRAYREAVDLSKRNFIDLLHPLASEQERQNQGQERPEYILRINLYTSNGVVQNLPRSNVQDLSFLTANNQEQQNHIVSDSSTDSDEEYSNPAEDFLNYLRGNRSIPSSIFQNNSGHVHNFPIEMQVNNHEEFRDCIRHNHPVSSSIFHPGTRHNSPAPFPPPHVPLSSPSGISLNFGNNVEMVPPADNLPDDLDFSPLTRLMHLFNQLTHQVNNTPINSPALEVHNYASTTVNTNGTEETHHTSEQKPLICAVFEYMSSRIGDKQLSYIKTVEIINLAIQEHIPPARQQEARKAAFFKLAGDNDYEQQLCLAMTFLQQEHPNSLGLWIRGFVEESINAYSAGDRTSCVKGIKERIATGLRGIDKTLDALFAQAEGSVFIKNFYIPLWNIDANISQVTQLLKDGGLTVGHTASETAEIFKQIFTNQLLEYRQSPDSFSDEMTYLAEMIEGGYEQIQKEMRK